MKLQRVVFLAVSVAVAPTMGWSLTVPEPTVTVVQTPTPVAVTDPATPSEGYIFDVVIVSGYCRIGGTDFYQSRFAIEREYNGSAWTTLLPYSSDAMTAAGGLTIGGTLTINSTTIAWGTGAQAAFLGALGTGTPSSANYLRGDGSWQPAGFSGTANRVTVAGTADSAVARIF